MKRAHETATEPNAESNAEPNAKVARASAPSPPPSTLEIRNTILNPLQPLGETVDKDNLPPYLGAKPDGKLAPMTPDRVAVARVADSRVFVASLGGARAIVDDIVTKGANPFRIGIFNVAGTPILHPETEEPLPFVINAKTIDDTREDVDLSTKSRWIATSLASLYWMHGNYDFVVINCKFGSNRSVALALALVMNPCRETKDFIPAIALDDKRKPSIQMQAEMTTQKRIRLWNALQDWIVNPKKDAARHFGIKGGWKSFNNFRCKGNFRPGDHMQLALWNLHSPSTA